MKAINIIDNISIVLLALAACILLIEFEKSKVRAYRENAKVRNWTFIVAVAFLVMVIVRLFDRFWNPGTLWGISYEKRVIAGLIASLASALLYIYVLFFALPKDTYGASSETKLVSDGIYGRCRHPGVYCFVLFAFSLAFTGGSIQLFVAAGIFSILNLIYVILQDMKYFPQYIEGYEEYKKEVPFLAFWK